MLPEHFYLLSTPGLEEYFSRYGYVGIYVWYVTIDQIGPIPEEITLIAIGYFTAMGMINPILAGLCAVAAFLTIDVIYFHLAKSGNKLFKKFKKRAEGPKLKAYKTRLRTHMLKTLFAISFIPRLRLFVPVLVALAELKFKKFIIYSAISLSLFSAIYIVIGILFHRYFHSFISNMSGTAHLILLIASVLGMIILTIVFIKKFKTS